MIKRSRSSMPGSELLVSGSQILDCGPIYWNSDPPKCRLAVKVSSIPTYNLGLHDQTTRLDNNKTNTLSLECTHTGDTVPLDDDLFARMAMNPVAAFCKAADPLSKKTMEDRMSGFD